MGKVRDVTSQDVNDYLRQIAGEDFTAKDFRTWGGTVLAAIALSKQEEFQTKKQAKSNIKTAICAVAELLGNTPAVCRKCYVHPIIVEAYLNRTRIAGLNGEQNIGASQSSRSGTSSSKVPARASNRRGLQKSHRLCLRDAPPDPSCTGEDLCRDASAEILCRVETGRR